VPPLFVAVAQIPRNESGKIMREALAAAYLEARPALTGKLG
jgi:acyl-coenzyme A synthetase/AMP-(fatty) acid ligase